MLATLAYVALTLLAGLRAHSLALLSEAGHNMSDFLALALSFVAVYFPDASADRQEDLWLPACGRSGGFYQRGHADRDLAMDWRGGGASAERSGNRAAAADDAGGGGRRGDEWGDCGAAVGRG